MDGREQWKIAGQQQQVYRAGVQHCVLPKAQGLTQEQLAELVGISRQHLGAIEAPNLCRPISLDLLFNLAAELEVEAYRLLMFRD